MKSFLIVSSYADSVLVFRGDLLRAVQSCGFEVHIATPNPSTSLIESLEKESFRVHPISMTRTGMNPVQDIKTFLSLMAVMRKARPDYVLSYTIKPVIYGSLAAAVMRVPHHFALITGLGYAFTEEGSGNGFLRSLAQKLYTLALKRCEKVFFQNPDDKQLFQELGILSPSTPSIVVNGSGVDTSSYSVQALPGSGTTFLLIARLLGNKGVREYVKAAQLVKQQYADATFLLVGWVDDNPDAILQSELDDWIASGVIDFRGKLSDVRPAIAEASVYVLPSYREGTPRTVLEAMAMGRAIITTDAPGCRETVVDGENGFLVPVKAVEPLANAMMKFLAQPGLAAEMGKRSRQIAETKYDVHQVNRIMLEQMGIQK